MTMTRYAALAALALAACDPATKEAATPPAAAETENAAPLLPYERFQLANGLDVVFHIDRSDPVVAVSLTAHVGSAREKPGRTGFAHLFEHLLFLESENLGKGGLDQMSARIGGSGANGSTNRDRTNYFQTVPKDALEKMIWAEADKLGWFINTVTEPVLAKEKQVVKNEKRQSYDNRPYGHTFYVLHKNLYPDDHPYNWQVIGSLADLDAAELEDVKEFFRDWYTPNNVTLTIAGDFDPAQAKAWVERYFAEIPRGPEVTPIEAPTVTLAASKSLFHEDNFATTPQLTRAWPTVPRFHEDSYPLLVLTELLTDGKSAPFTQVLLDEKKLTSNVGAFDYTSELAGEWILQVTAFDGIDLDTVDAALAEAFARFEADGVDADRLRRVKTGQEVDFYGGLQSVLGKNVNLATYAIFADDPGFVDEELKRIRAVTAADVMRVYETYIKGKPSVSTSFVPKGEASLALAGAARAEVVEEPIVQGAEDAVDPNVVASYEPTPSEIDRSVEPPYGEKPVLTPPTVWEAATAEGLAMSGVVDRELPLVEFELAIAGGRLHESPTTAGAAALVAEMMSRGTTSKTAAEFEDALADLGAALSVRSGREEIVVSGSSLARNFEATMALLQEMLLAPRWDESEYELAVVEALDRIQASRADPLNIAGRSFAYALYGADSAWSTAAVGSETSLAGLSLDDLKAFHGATLTPQLASFRVVGDVPEDRVREAVMALSAAWPVRPMELPAAPETVEPPAQVLFYDVPGAKQSIFRFGRPAMLRADADFYPATVMNYRLGGGGFASRLTQELREGKGYTYGIGSGFQATNRAGEFTIFSGVRANVTLEAAALVKDILGAYGETFTEEDLAVTQSFFVKSKARSFESYNAKLNMLENIAAYGLPHDYVLKENEIVDAMTVADVQRLAAEWIDPDDLVWVIVGDAETQFDRLAELGLGAPVLITDEVDGLTR